MRLTKSRRQRARLYSCVRSQSDCSGMIGPQCVEQRRSVIRMMGQELLPLIAASAAKKHRCETLLGTGLRPDQGTQSLSLSFALNSGRRLPARGAGMESMQPASDLYRLLSARSLHQHKIWHPPPLIAVRHPAIEIRKRKGTTSIRRQDRDKPNQKL